MPNGEKSPPPHLAAGTTQYLLLFGLCALAVAGVLLAHDSLAVGMILTILTPAVAAVLAQIKASNDAVAASRVNAGKIDDVAVKAGEAAAKAGLVAVKADRAAAQAHVSDQIKNDKLDAIAEVINGQHAAMLAEIVRLKEELARMTTEAEIKASQEGRRGGT